MLSQSRDRFKQESSGNMSAQANKVLRRDLRRAVGAEAIGVIDHNASALTQLQERLDLQYAMNTDEWLSAGDRMTRYVLQQQVTELREAQRQTHPPGSEVGLIVYDIQRDTFNFDGSHAEIAVRNAHQRIVGRTFWQRLRWLLTGR